MQQNTGATLHSTFCTWVHHFTRLFIRIHLFKLMSRKPSILLENEKYYAALHSSLKIYCLEGERLLAAISIKCDHKHKMYVSHLNFSCGLIYQSVSALLPRYAASSALLPKEWRLTLSDHLSDKQSRLSPNSAIHWPVPNKRHKRQRTHRRPPSLTGLPLAGGRGWFDTSSLKGSF